MIRLSIDQIPSESDTSPIFVGNVTRKGLLLVMTIRFCCESIWLSSTDEDLNPGNPGLANKPLSTGARQQGVCSKSHYFAG